MKITKTIIIEVDENKKGNLFMQDDMTPMECIDLLISTAAWYYKGVCGIDSIDKATEAMGIEILQSIARR